MRYPAVCSCFLPLIVHFIIAQAADLVLAQTAGAGSPDSAAGVSVLTSAVCIPLFALWLRSEEKFREEKAAGADRTAWICLAFVCGAALSLLWGGCSTFSGLQTFFRITLRNVYFQHPSRCRSWDRDFWPRCVKNCCSGD